MTPQGRDAFDRAPEPSPGPAAGDGVPRFEGFDPPESNFWRLPNNWFDLVAGFTSWAEHKVVEYILRHTWGYNEYGVSKLITMDEFMHGRKRRDGSRMDAGCGMAENSIKKGIADAVAHGFLIVEVDTRDLGRIRKFYAPRMRIPVSADEGMHALPSRDQFPTPGGQALTPDPRILTLDRHPLTQVGQGMIPRPSDTDPRTGKASKANTYEQQLETDNMHAGDTSLLRSLEARLTAQGIAPARAAALVRRVPAEQIERQLGWIDRRRFRNRAATLIRAIEEDFAPPSPHRSLDDRSTASFDPSKFFRGPYAVCPVCGARPCAANCSAQEGRGEPRPVFS